MSDNTLNQSKIKELLTDFYNNQNLCGFEVFAVMKAEPKLKKVSLSENINDEGNTFRDILKEMIFTVISDCFLPDEAEYVDGTRLADNQNKFLIINQSGSFTPFMFFNSSETDEVFDLVDLSNVSGVAFKLRKGEKTIWCYQHLWSIMIPNSKKNNFMARITKFENQTIFEEQKDSMLTIAKRVDVLVVDDYLITSNAKLLQNNFGFQEYIYQSAEKAVSNITAIKLVSNSEKLTEYISRGKTKYAKKMMRIGNSKVLLLSVDELLGKIRTVDRWKGKFNIDESTNRIVLNTYNEVENLIDLFDERYTRSDITDTEYDTDVKTIAQPISK